ncbi:unnamed protein product, partial [Ixodes hexagonus]
MSIYRIAEAAIDDRADALRELGRFVWENPELGFEEIKAHEYITAYLESEGFQVSRNYLLPTAFRAEFGGSGPCVAFLCEYDALPGIGHACGHNLIAESSVAAAIGAKAALEARESSHNGRIVVLGTPAEENGSGKQLLIDKGAFKDLDVAMMAHPVPTSSNLRFQSIALARLRVVYNGTASHAGQSPWEGVNALDAAVGAYVNVSMLRQQMKTNCRVHGVIKRGGLSSNVIPDETEMEYRVRAPTTEELAYLKDRVEGCFLAAAEATGCSVSVDVPTPMVKHLVPNEHLVRVFQKHGEALGMDFFDADPANAKLLGASTDAGNASHVVPLIHPGFALKTTARNHTAAFTEVAGTEAAHQEALITAKALCFTLLDVLENDELLRDVKNEFQAA